MNIYRHLAALLVAPALTLTQPSLAQESTSELNRQKLSWLAKPAVVRIWNPCFGVYRGIYNVKGQEKEIVQKFDLSFFGTGFFVNSNGYIVTSDSLITEQECTKRLADNIERTLQTKYGIYEKKENIEDKLTKTKNYLFEQLVILPSANVPAFPFEIKKPNHDSKSSSKTGNEVSIIKIPVTKAPTLKLGDSNDVNIQDRVMTVGYPTNFSVSSVNLEEPKFSPKSYLEASVQEGKIASNQKNLASGYPILQVDIQAKRGSGGSPLLDSQGNVIGMLVERKAWAGDNETIPLAIPTSTIQMFINEADTSNDYGKITDAFYQEGLELFFDKNYQEAESRFEEVKRNYKIEGVSAHTQAEQLIERIDRIQANRRAKPWTNPKYQVVFGLVAVGGIAAALFSSKDKLLGLLGLSQNKSNSSNSSNSSANSPHIPTQDDTVYPPDVSRLELEFLGEHSENSEPNEKEFVLYKEEHRLGRDPTWADLAVSNNWSIISNRHAILKKEGENYRIYDGDGKKNSSNGLWINEDSRVDPKEGYSLKNGDRLTIGQNANEQITVTFYNSVRATTISD